MVSWCTLELSYQYVAILQYNVVQYNSIHLNSSIYQYIAQGNILQCIAHIVWTRTGSLECECWQTSFSAWEPKKINILAVLRLAEHNYTDLIITVPVLQYVISYCEHLACNIQHANLLYCNSRAHHSQCCKGFTQSHAMSAMKKANL